jgi:hypothetical protein
MRPDAWTADSDNPEYTRYITGLAQIGKPKQKALVADAVKWALEKTSISDSSVPVRREANLLPEIHLRIRAIRKRNRPG